MTKGAFDWEKAVPPLVIGRVAYDNWVVDYGVHHFETVDVTLTVKAVHQVLRACSCIAAAGLVAMLTTFPVVMWVDRRQQTGTLQGM